MENGRLPVKRVAVQAVDLLRRAADVAHSVASAAHINFQVNAGPARFSPMERALQVVNELVSNAIRFSPPNTAIRLATPAVRRRRSLLCH